MEQFDVIVIGGGPAGIAAAISCTQSGVKPLLVTERLQHLADNNDGTEPLQTLHPGAQNLLNQLQIPGVIAHSTKGTYTGIRVGETITPLSTAPGETWTGNHISPNLFSAYSIKMAQQMGVKVLFDARVTDIILEDAKVSGIILANGRKINCAYLIDASGHKRFAGRYLNFEEQLHSQPLICRTGNSLIKSDDPDKETAVFTPGKFGWTWEAFSSSNYYTWTKLTLKNSADIEQPIPGKQGRVTGGDMQWRVFRPVVYPGMLLVGDAAGVLDPAAGQGILNGLISGIMGAETVIKCIRQPLIATWYLTQYDSWYMDLFNKKAEMLKKRYGELGIDVD